jgi:hypothetical protein
MNFPTVHDATPDASVEDLAPATTDAPVTTTFADAFKAAAKAQEAPKPAEAPPKPAEAASAKPADAPPAAIKSTKAADEWRNMKSIHAQELTKVQQEAAAARAEAKAAAERISAAEKTAREYSDKLRIVALADHPEFKQKYTAREEAAFAALKGLAGDKGDELSKLLKLPQSDVRDSRIGDLVDNLPSLTRVKIGGLLQRIDEISTERESELSTATARLKEMTDAQRQQHEQQQTQAKARSASVFEEQASNARALEVFELKEGDDAHNAEVAKLLETARTIFDGQNSEAEIAKAALWAASAPVYRNALHAQLAINAKQAAEIARLSGAGPALAGSKAASGKAAEAESGDFLAKMKTLMSG